MGIKLENQSSIKLPRETVEAIDHLLDGLPREHTRGINRVRIVDYIVDQRIVAQHRNQLPGLYHQRQGTTSAWLEVAVAPLLQPSQTFFKRIAPRLSFRSNLAAVLISLVGQHYHLTLRHSIKKGQLEPAIRVYTEKHLKLWGQRQHNWRTKLFKPLQPVLEKWAKSLQKQAAKAKPKP